MDDAGFLIARNLARLRETIAAAAREAGRRPEDIRLVAASKTQPPEAIEAAVAAGQKDFGENTVQDALTKIPHFRGRDLTWHFIGHLQSNKTKFIPGNFSWVHSLDTPKLAARLSRQAQEQNTKIDVLIEVNIARDSAKHGVMPEELFPLLEQLLEHGLPGIELRGLMAVGPHPATELQRRAAFAGVRRLRDDCVRRFALRSFTELSMGMSGDFVEAIREGATMIRVGSAIFGERDYSRK